VRCVIGPGLVRSCDITLLFFGMLTLPGRALCVETRPCGTLEHGSGAGFGAQAWGRRMRAHNMLILLIALVAGYAVGYARLTRQTPTEARPRGLPPTIGRPTRCRRESWSGRSRWTGRADAGRRGDAWDAGPVGVDSRVGCGRADEGLGGGLSRYRWVQGFAFVFLLLLAMQLLDLPLEIYGHRVGLTMASRCRGGQLAGRQGQDVRAGMDLRRPYDDADLPDASQWPTRWCSGSGFQRCSFW